jgi:hypothetical protein
MRPEVVNVEWRPRQVRCTEGDRELLDLLHE